MASDTTSDASTCPPSPTAARQRPVSSSLNRIGIDPSEIIGKVLQRARPSPTHPALSLDFTDHTTVQILVDGYSPVHPGIPKRLEMDSDLNALFSSKDPLGLEILDCALITLQDAAFDYKHSNSSSGVVRWDQKHLGIAFKFLGHHPRWHCIWATKEEYDEKLGAFVFRSYDDVYLKKLHRTSKRRGWRKSIPQPQGATL